MVKALKEAAIPSFISVSPELRSNHFFIRLHLQHRREKNSGRLGLSKISRCVQQQQQWTTEEVGNSSCATSCSKLTDEVTDPSDAWSGESPTATSQTLKPADP